MLLNKIKKFFSKGKPYNSDNNTSNSEIEMVSFEKRMKHLEHYFKWNSETNESFIPEYNAAKKINEIVLKDDITEHDIHEVVSIFNEANLKPHYNGSKWFDLKIHMHSFILEQGLMYEDLPNGNIELSKNPTNKA